MYQFYVALRFFVLLLFLLNDSDALSLYLFVLLACYYIESLVAWVLIVCSLDYSFLLGQTVVISV
jgi:hypothetical protein